MDKFTILYKKGLHGAIVGTESGNILSITKEQRHNQEWLDNHTSKELKVFRVFDLEKISTSDGTYNFIPEDILSHPIKPENFTIRTSRFVIMFQGYFDTDSKTWIIEEKPFIQP